MEIGLRIKRARERGGMSQTELADAVGVTRGLVGQWESHRKKPGRENLRKIAKVTETSVEYLLGNVPEMDRAVGDLSEREGKLIRAFRRMSPRQQERLAEFIDEAVSARREVEQERRPAKGEPVG